MTSPQTEEFHGNGVTNSDEEILESAPNPVSDADSDDPGLAYIFSQAWLPSSVEPQKRKQASIFFASLILLYMTFAIASIVLNARERFQPPMSFRRETEQTTFKPPFIAFCIYGDDYLTVTCNNYNAENGCKISELRDDENSISCTSVEIDDVIYPDFLHPTSIYLDGFPDDLLDPYIYYYVSSSSITDIDDYFTATVSITEGLFRPGGEYRFEITKQTEKSLIATAGGFWKKYQETTSYNVNELYVGSSTSYDNVIFIASNIFGVEVLEETDPFNLFSLLGSIAGSVQYVILAFSLAFGGSVYLYKKKLDDAHIKFLVQQEKLHSREVNQLP